MLTKPNQGNDEGFVMKFGIIYFLCSMVLLTVWFLALLNPASWVEAAISDGFGLLVLLTAGLAVVPGFRFRIFSSSFAIVAILFVVGGVWWQVPGHRVVQKRTNFLTVCDHLFLQMYPAYKEREITIWNSINDFDSHFPVETDVAESLGFDPELPIRFYKINFWLTGWFLALAIATLVQVVANRCQRQTGQTQTNRKQTEN